MIVVPLGKFQATITQLLSTEAKAIFLITSQKNTDGSYWCPDCQAIKPLYATMQNEVKATGLPFYLFVAGDKPTWKDPNNLLRINKATLAKSVPTLGYFDGKKLIRRLVQAQINDEEQRKLLLQDLKSHL